MNASLARRIRNAEAVLISALDRQKNDQRDWSRRLGSAHPTRAAAAWHSTFSKDESRVPAPSNDQLIRS